MLWPHIVSTHHNLFPPPQPPTPFSPASPPIAFRPVCLERRTPFNGFQMPHCTDHTRPCANNPQIEILQSRHFFFVTPSPSDGYFFFPRLAWNLQQATVMAFLVDQRGSSSSSSSCISTKQQPKRCLRWACKCLAADRFTGHLLEINALLKQTLGATRYFANDSITVN